MPFSTAASTPRVRSRYKMPAIPHIHQVLTRHGRTATQITSSGFRFSACSGSVDTLSQRESLLGIVSRSDDAQPFSSREREHEHDALRQLRPFNTRPAGRRLVQAADSDSPTDAVTTHRTWSDPQCNCTSHFGTSPAAWSAGTRSHPRNAADRPDPNNPYGPTGRP